MWASQDFGSIIYPGIDSQHINTAVAKVSALQCHIIGIPVVKQEEDLKMNADVGLSDFREIVEDGKFVVIIE